LVGYLPHEEIRYFYRAADVFVYPSLYETFGLTLVEAMASGCPIVTSDCSCLPEIVGNAALLVQPEDTSQIAGAIARVLGDSELRQALIEKGYSRAKDFSWEKTAAKTRAVLLRAGSGEALLAGAAAL
jgi:glycosyltransferase involved in cell wall biosynthesis